MLGMGGDTAIQRSLYSIFPKFLDDKSFTYDDVVVVATSQHL